MAGLGVGMAKALPAFMRAMRAVAEANGLTVYEKAALTAAVQWVNFETGQLWPSRKAWADAVGCSERWLHTVLRSLIRKGVARLVDASKGGRGQTSTWEITLLAVDKPGTMSTGLETRQITTNPANDDRNPANQDAKPGKSERNPANDALNPARSVPANSEQPLEQVKTERVNTHASAEVFSNDRAVRTGNVPPGFAMFIAEYPQGKKTDRGGLLTLWKSLGLEEESGAVLAGLRAWNACDDWQRGFAVHARRFIEDRFWDDSPPPPKPTTQAPEKVRPW